MQVTLAGFNSVTATLKSLSVGLKERSFTSEKTQLNRVETLLEKNSQLIIVRLMQENPNRSHQYFQIINLTVAHEDLC